MEHKCKKTDLKTVEKCELNREQIIKALECCSSKIGCKECPLQPKESLAICVTQISKYAFEEICRLTEENERLKGFASSKCEECAGCTQWNCDCANIEAQAKADTVRKMKEIIYERLDISVEGYSSEEIKSDVRDMVYQIAEEILEE